MNSSILVGILTGTSAIVGWVAGRKKYKAEVAKDLSEVKKNEEDIRESRIASLSTSIDIYDKIFVELKRQIEQLTQKCSDLTDRCAELTDKCAELSIEIMGLRKENEDLKDQIHELTNQLKK